MPSGRSKVAQKVFKKNCFPWIDNNLNALLNQKLIAFNTDTIFSLTLRCTMTIYTHRCAILLNNSVGVNGAVRLFCWTQSLLKWSKQTDRDPLRPNTTSSSQNIFIRALSDLYFGFMRFLPCPCSVEFMGIVHGPMGIVHALVFGVEFWVKIS